MPKTPEEWAARRGLDATRVLHREILKPGCLWVPHSDLIEIIREAQAEARAEGAREALGSLLEEEEEERRSLGEPEPAIGDRVHVINPDSCLYNVTGRITARSPHFRVEHQGGGCTYFDWLDRGEFMVLDKGPKEDGPAE